MTGRRSRHGHALLGTMAFLILIMLLWTVIFAHLGGYMRVTKAGLARHDRITGQTRAMAWGLAMLEIRRAAPGPLRLPRRARCGQPDAASSSSPTSRIAPWQYSVNVRPAGPDDGELPLVPADFGPGNGKPMRREHAAGDASPCPRRRLVPRAMPE